MGTDSPDEAARLCEEGYAFLEARNFHDAHLRLARARAMAPDNPLIHYRMGLLFSDTNRPGDAVLCFDAALAIDRDDFRAHNNRGSALQVLGRTTEAEAAFRRALELAPDTELPYLNLGQLLDETGRKQEAASVYRNALARGLNPPRFEHHLAALLGTTTDRAPDRWVVATFDNFAPTFDAHLGALGYDVPSRLASMLKRHGCESCNVLDLGCGTGLCGVSLGAVCSSIVGVDLSPRMIAQAVARNIYHELIVSEVHDWLAKCSPARFDAVIAADLLIYIGAVERLFGQVGQVLKANGLFAFSTEEHMGSGFRLLPTGRYVQSEEYIAAAASPHFSIVASDAAIIRKERGSPVGGRLWLLRRN